MKTYTLDADGSLVILDDFDGATDGTGAPMQSRLSIRPEQIAAHRRDVEFDAALPDEIRAQLDGAGA